MFKFRQNNLLLLQQKSFSLVYNKAIIYLRGKCRMKVIKRDGRAVDFDQEKLE